MACGTQSNSRIFCERSDGRVKLPFSKEAVYDVFVSEYPACNHVKFESFKRRDIGRFAIFRSGTQLHGEPELRRVLGLS